MEKLKAKHDHKLTDILKVMIFGLMLILPGLILLPSMLYYGVNEHATAPTEQIEIYEYKQIDFNQYAHPINSNNYNILNGDVVITNNLITFNGNGLVDETTATRFTFVATHYYYFRYDSNNSITGNANVIAYIGDYYTYNVPSGNSNGYIRQAVNDTTDTINFRVQNYTSGTWTISNLNVFDLTQMFGEGNEPTKEQFDSYFTENYYEYTESNIETLEIPTGTYETYTDITKQIQYNWNSLWKQPLFNWTDYTILKQGLDNFTNVFGITNTSNLTNLIVYELIMVAIYIVIDIILTMFKWLTHLIGEK